jgi:pimeloyl-ACP methyl ester carboxylesterase
LLAFSVATAATADQEAVRLTFAEPRAALVLHPGSLAVGVVVSKAVSFGRWAVTLFCGTAGRLRSAEAAARAFVENSRTARAAQDPRPLPLLRLDDRSAAIPPGKNVVLFLHGLMSTNLGTFDGFMRRWSNPALPAHLFDNRQALNDELRTAAREAIKDSVVFAGWPHDTLTSIDQSAHALSRLIDDRLGADDAKIAFVCHSRGGLVARAAAEKLYGKDADKWKRQICCCISFGTPHAGVALAEHPDRQLGAFVLAGMSRKQIASLTDIAAYLEQRGKIEGIDDLRPSSAPGEPFLRKLEKLEWEKAPGGSRRRLDIYAVGGVAQIGQGGGPLLERLGRLYQAYQAYYQGLGEHDLVVPLASAVEANKPNSGYEPTRTTCDHFSYFSEECGTAAIDKAIWVLLDHFGLTEAVQQALDRTDRDRRTLESLRHEEPRPYRRLVGRRRALPPDADG